MRYITRHLKADGTLEITLTDGDTKTTYISDRPILDGPDVTVKREKFHNPGYNLHPSGSAAVRREEISNDLNRLRSEYIHTNGMSKGGTMRHIARIPAEEFYYHKTQQGLGDGHMQDKGELEKFIKKGNYQVVSKL